MLHTVGMADVDTEQSGYQFDVEYDVSRRRLAARVVESTYDWTVYPDGQQKYRVRSFSAAVVAAQGSYVSV
jgi:hypothetical protein